MKLPIVPSVIPRVSDADRAALGAFLAAGPLYRAVTIPGLWFAGDTLQEVLPSEIRRACDSTKCDGFESQWALETVLEGANPASAVVGYRCRNCGADFEASLRWDHETAARRARESEAPTGRVGAPLGAAVKPAPDGFHFQKVGQWPAPTVTLPPDLAKALGKHQGFYRQGMVSRNQGYGIGALAYFRRIVEDTSNDMLDLLADALREQSADPVVVQSVVDAKRETVFEKKAKTAAAALPDALRPSGFNPFESLHDVYSTGVHGLTDEQCIEMVDEVREDIEIIFKSLKTHVDDRRKYKEAAQRFQEKRARRK